MKTGTITCAYCGVAKEMKRGAKTCSAECRNGLRLLPRASDRALADELTRRRLPVEGTPLVTDAWPRASEGFALVEAPNSLAAFIPTDRPVPTAVGQSRVIWPNDDTPVEGSGATYADLKREDYPRWESSKFPAREADALGRDLGIPSVTPEETAEPPLVVRPLPEIEYHWPKDATSVEEALRIPGTVRVVEPDEQRELTADDFEDI